MHIAVVDDDPAEHMILSEIGAAIRPEAVFEGFLTLADFLAAGPARFDLVFLDRRLPPYETYRETLPAIDAAGYTGHVVLMTAAVLQTPLEGFRFHVTGPVDKLSLIDPSCLAACLDFGDCDCAPGSGE